MKKIKLIIPDDWHCHLRDGAYLRRTVSDVCKQFARVIVMPNLLPPVTTLADAVAYRQRILAAMPSSITVDPLMTFYLTEKLTEQDIIQAKKDASVIACKLYPAGATTHSEAGVTDITALYPVIEMLQKHNMPLLIHGEATDPRIDITAREAAFIDHQLTPLLAHFPALRVVLEHISTKNAVDFVAAASSNVAATITAHHLLLNLNDLLANGIKPHYYCKPIINRLSDQAALIKAAISGNPKFFLGTDSAPHSQQTKECASGCAGIYSAHAAIELYAEVFSRHHALDKLENFASCFGPMFYKLPLNQTTITLIEKPWQVPTTLSFGDEQLVPFFAGETLNWQLHHENN